MTRARLGLAGLLAAAALTAGCGRPPPPNCCGSITTIAKNVDYVGSFPAPDGGTPTTVKVNIAPNGNTTLTFEKNGRVIVQGFSGTSP